MNLKASVQSGYNLLCGAIYTKCLTNIGFYEILGVALASLYLKIFLCCVIFNGKNYESQGLLKLKY